MNQISDLPNPLKILFQEYNQGQIESVGFRSFCKPSTSHQPQEQGGKHPRPCA